MIKWDLFFQFDPSIATDEMQEEEEAALGLDSEVSDKSGKSWDEMWIVDNDNDEVDQGMLGVQVFSFYPVILFDFTFCFLSLYLTWWYLYNFYYWWQCYFSHFFNLQSFSLFQCHSATHFKAFCNNNHIWYTSLGLSPSQALGFGKPSIQAWLIILKAQAHQSQAWYIHH